MQTYSTPISKNGQAVLLSTLLLLIVGPLAAQTVRPGGTTVGSTLNGADKYNAITTAVPFLTITPDARTGGLGECGTATSPDANSPQFNTAKLAFAEKKASAGLSVTPWLRNLGFNDMYLAYLSGYYKPTKQDAISFGFTYFNLGQLTFTDNSGATIKDFNPSEFAIAAGYSRQLTTNFAVGVTGKFIYSNLAGNTTVGSTSSRPGVDAAVDISGYYKKEIALGGTPAELVFGGAINNFGPKISYSNNNRRDFIPTTLRAGAGLTLNLDPYNKLTFVFEPSKLLVPTPKPLDSTSLSQQGGNAGTTADKGLLAGIFGSFNDAPGGSAEEIREIMLAGGVEYWYDNLFALRAGYFNENKYKGNRKYFTAGIGLRYQQFGLDVSYLVPTATGNNNPLANTLRYTLIFNFAEGAQKEESVTE